MKLENFIFGSSKDIFQRWEEHFSSLENNNHSNKHFQNSYNKYGKFVWICEIIEEYEPIENLLEQNEQKWLDKTKCFDHSIGYNICEKAGRPPIQHLFGDTNPAKTPEARAKISAASKGRMNKPENKIKMLGENNPFFGEHHSLETIEFLRNLHKGKIIDKDIAIKHRSIWYRKSDVWKNS